MKKILALILALSLVFALAACGGNTEDETTTAAPVETTLADETTTLADESTTLADESTTLADESTTLADESTTLADGETTTAAADMTKAEFVAFLNAETAKIAKSGSYSLKRTCEYTTPIDVGSATGILNSIISAVDSNASLDTVVGGFLGIGTTEGKLPKDKGINENYKIKATNLSEGDLGSFNAANGVYTFTLANATNPQKNNSTAFAKFTNDFITHNEVASAISGLTSAISLKESNVNYTNIKVEVKVVDGKIANVKYSYNFDAALALKAGLTINGSGAAKTTGVYSAISY